MQWRVGLKKEGNGIEGRIEEGRRWRRVELKKKGDGIDGRIEVERKEMDWRVGLK